GGGEESGARGGRRREAERAPAGAPAGAGGGAPARRRARNDIALDELPVARQHELLDAAGDATEARLVDAVERNAHLAALQDLRDVAALRRVAHRLSHQRLGAAQEALAALPALAAPG